MGLSKDKDVDVIVDLSPRALARNGYNKGLILGKTTVIDAETRVKVYGDASEMLEDGFSSDDALYKGAVAYFNQQDNLGASLSEVYIGAVGAEEEYADALRGCKEKNENWYGFTTCEEISDKDNEAIADAAEALDDVAFFAITKTADVLTGSEGTFLAKVSDKKLQKTIVTYHEDALFGCGLMGYAMGANTGLNNSAYSLKYKQITGFTPSKLNTTQVANIEKYYGNCYITRAAAQYEQGTCADGTWFDEIINLDVLVNNIQLNVYDLLYSLPKEAQTEAGHSDIAAVISDACETSRKIGFIGGNLKWRKSSVLALSKGDVLPNGYLVQWEDVNEQSDADRDARKSQPFYVCVNLASAIHSVVIKVNVSR